MKVDPQRLVGLPTVLILSAAILAAGPALTKPSSDPMLFAAEMAQKGNWREALYRWRKAYGKDPDNPAILNNLAVALETRGESDEAAELYARLSRQGAELPGIAFNIRSFNRFWKQDIPETGGDGKDRRKPENNRRSLVVDVTLPVPARLDVSGVNSILIASFLLEETDLLDINREVARFLRSELRRNTHMEPVDAAPPPPVPEQTLEDLAGNSEFWKHLGRRYGADMIVSGRVFYDRRESSGYEPMDFISRTTGHKVRQTVFVEQEDFLFTLELLFIDAASGEVRFRDTVKKTMRFKGLNNDPITAFYELSESIAGDVLSIVSPRRRSEHRVIYKGRRP